MIIAGGYSKAGDVIYIHHLSRTQAGSRGMFSEDTQGILGDIRRRSPTIVIDLLAADKDAGKKRENNNKGESSEDGGLLFSNHNKI